MQDPIAFQRYEYKYIIPAALIEPIAMFIRPYCQIDPYSDQEVGKFYTTRTLYLDTADYRTYWDKEDEVPNRFKLRVRTYGTDSRAPVKFEVKQRVNDVFQKSSVATPADVWPALIADPGEFSPGFTSVEQSAFNRFIYLTRTIGASPRMLVKYERRAYRSRVDDYVRISFDRRLRYQPVHTYDLEGQAARWMVNDDSDSLGHTGGLILELKFTAAAPVWLLDLVRRFELVRRGFSKYCSAVRRTFGEGQPPWGRRQ
jgi:hypothetical protein